MIRDVVFKVRYSLSQMFTFNSKKKQVQRLKTSFGELKEDNFDFSFIERYFRKKDHSDAHQVLSDKTCNDLDLEDVFEVLDRTHSKVGQQYFYDVLRTIKPNAEKTQLNEEIIAELSNDEDFRIATQKRLEQLTHKDVYYINSLFQDEHLEPSKWFFIVNLLSFTSLIAIVLSFYKSQFLLLLLGVFCINFVLHHWNKKNLVQYVGSIPQLLKMNNVAAHFFEHSLFKKINPDLRKSIKVINEVKRRMSFFKMEAKLQGESEVIAWFIFEIIKTTFLLEPLLLFGVLKRLNTKRREIEEVFNFVGHIDMLVSIASVRKGTNEYCLPVINDNNQIIAEEVSHPLIFNCTKNSIRITEKSILLTGSNMSGKTSFIRAIGVNVITGLTINTCFAKSMTFPLLKIFSAIRISDDLLNDKSYYFEEVLTIKEMMNESRDGRNLFLLDEIFKGTNTVERISAGKSILSLLAKNENKVLVSTHDIELTDLLSEEYELYHFSETVMDNSVGFDYKLKEGKLQQRNAIRILEINDYPKEVVQEALEIAQKLDKLYNVESLKVDGEL